MAFQDDIAQLNSAVNNATNVQMVSEASKEARKENQRQRDFAVAMWNRTNRYNSPEQVMNRLRAAGLNPNLALGNGMQSQATSVSSAPGGNVPQAQQLADPGLAMSQISAVSMQREMMEEQITNQQLVNDNQKIKNAVDKFDAEKQGVRFGVEMQDAEDRHNESVAKVYNLNKSSELLEQQRKKEVELTGLTHEEVLIAQIERGMKDLEAQYQEEYLKARNEKEKAEVQVAYAMAKDYYASACLKDSQTALNNQELSHLKEVYKFDEWQTEADFYDHYQFKQSTYDENGVKHKHFKSKDVEFERNAQRKSLMWKLVSSVIPFASGLQDVGTRATQTGKTTVRRK